MAWFRLAFACTSGANDAGTKRQNTQLQLAKVYLLYAQFARLHCCDGQHAGHGQNLDGFSCVIVFVLSCVAPRMSQVGAAP